MMTRKEVEEFTTNNYPYYSTDYVFLILEKYNFDTTKAHEILSKDINEVVKEVRSILASKMEMRRVAFQNSLQTIPNLKNGEKGNGTTR